MSITPVSLGQLGVALALSRLKRTGTCPALQTQIMERRLARARTFLQQEVTPPALILEECEGLI
ncbi:MAG: hypothetical protein ABIZ80_15420, partial [Bryobacteraceae bacterium]